MLWICGKCPRGLHWSEWQDAGAPTLGAQEGLKIRACVPVGGCRACNEWVPYNQVGGGRGGEPSSTLPDVVALEAWHIQTQRHRMNRDDGPLSPVYNPLVHQSRLHFPPLIMIWLDITITTCVCLLSPISSVCYWLHHISNIILFYSNNCYILLTVLETFTHLFSPLSATCVHIKSAYRAVL